MNNGHESNLEERMQRAERIVAALPGIQDETRAELRTLAKSQVFMTETLGKVGVRLDEVGQRVDQWEARMNELSAKINQIAQAQLAGDERLKALIHYFRRHPEEHGQQ